jgi:hypothetical protein
MQEGRGETEFREIGSQTEFGNQNVNETEFREIGSQTEFGNQNVNMVK